MKLPEILLELSDASILFTSRNEQDIQAKVAHSIPSITISVSDNAEDIKLYLKQRVELLRLKHEDLEGQIVEDVSRHANEMFLYARLVIDELRAKKTVKQIRNSINVLPNGLDAIYGRKFANIDSLDAEDKQTSYLLLQLICEAMEPLTLPQIKYITTIDEDGLLDIENELRDPREFIHECW